MEFIIVTLVLLCALIGAVVFLARKIDNIELPYPQPRKAEPNTDPLAFLPKGQ